MAEPISKEDFDNATPWAKGYLVYMAGHRADQPNIPANYEPTDAERAEYERGQFDAILHVQDTP